MALRISLVMTALLFSPSKALLKASFTSSGMEKFIVAMADEPIVESFNNQHRQPRKSVQVAVLDSCVARALELARHPR